MSVVESQRSLLSYGLIRGVIFALVERSAVCVQQSCVASGGNAATVCVCVEFIKVQGHLRQLIPPFFY